MDDLWTGKDDVQVLPQHVWERTEGVSNLVFQEDPYAYVWGLDTWNELGM